MEQHEGDLQPIKTALPNVPPHQRRVFPQRVMQCLHPATKKLEPLPPIPQHLLAKLERACRCACGGHRFSDDSDGQGLTARMHGHRSGLLQQRMYGFGAELQYGSETEYYRHGHHATIVFSPSLWRWIEVHVCQCPGPGPKEAKISGRDRAAGMED